MRLNNREDLTPICATENVPLFVMYIKKELPDKHKSKLETHLSHCSDCKINLAYVEEILQFKHPITLDEKTLLLKYLSDPLFYYFIQGIRKQVLNEVKDIVKDLSIDLKSDNIEIHKDEKPKQSKQSSKLTYQKRPYSYTVMTAVIAAFVSLSSLIVLGLGIKYPALQSYLPFSKQDSTALDANSPNNLSSDLSIDLSKATETNRYQQLDTAIDEFLATKNREHLAKAESIAKDIKLFYEDNYGVDLVNYYNTAPSLALPNLLDCRKQLEELTNKAKTDNYQECLINSLELEKEFLSYGNVIEAYKSKALINKLYVQLHNNEVANLVTQEGLKFSTDNNYLLLKSDFLLWEAKRLCEIPDFLSAESSFIQVIEIGSKLNSSKLINGAGMSLAMLYYNNNDNKKAFDLTKKLLANFNNYKSIYAISLLQIAGLTSFNLHYSAMADSYLKEAIKYSQELNIPTFTVRSYSFLALTLSEQKKFAEANYFYSKAELEVANIKDSTAKQEALSIVIGYKAKAMLLNHDYEQALELYRYKLDIINSIKLSSNLEVSQVNSAIAIALKALGQTQKAKEHNAIAKHYKSLADTKKESSNCLLSFAPTSCSFDN